MEEFPDMKVLKYKVIENPTQETEKKERGREKEWTGKERSK